VELAAADERVQLATGRSPGLMAARRIRVGDQLDSFTSPSAPVAPRAPSAAVCRLNR